MGRHHATTTPPRRPVPTLIYDYDARTRAYVPVPWEAVAAQVRAAHERFFQRRTGRVPDASFAAQTADSVARAKAGRGSL